LSFEFTYIGKDLPSMTSMHYDNISTDFPFRRELGFGKKAGFRDIYELTPKELIEKKQEEDKKKQAANQGADNA
jgi:hypothetical protein